MWRCDDAGAADPAASLSLRASADPARALAFASPASLAVAGADGSLLTVDVDSGKPTGRLARASESAFSRVAAAAGVRGAPPAAVLTGDDGGADALWDPRSPSPAAAWADAHDDYVGDVIPVPGTGCAASVGGDGVLRVLDVAAAAAAPPPPSTRHDSASDPDEDELNCLAVTTGRRLAAGSAGGVLSLWAWGAARGCADRMPLPRTRGDRPAISSLAAAAPDGSPTLLAGCDDGGLRVLTVLPNAVAATVASAHGPRAPPLERVRVGGAPDRRLVATVAAACREVRVWDAGALFGAGEGEGSGRRRKGGGGAGGDRKKARPGAASFFEDLL